jgi:hypothetical protein
MDMTTPVQLASTHPAASCGVVIDIYDDDLLVEYHLFPGDARTMVVDTSAAAGLELLPANPRFVKRVKQLGRHRYLFVFTTEARQRSIEICFAPTEEEK